MSIANVLLDQLQSSNNYDPRVDLLFQAYSFLKLYEFS